MRLHLGAARHFLIIIIFTRKSVARFFDIIRVYICVFSAGRQTASARERVNSARGMVEKIQYISFLVFCFCSNGNRNFHLKKL